MLAKYPDTGCCIAGRTGRENRIERLVQGTGGSGLADPAGPEHASAVGAVPGGVLVGRGTLELAGMAVPAGGVAGAGDVYKRQVLTGKATGYYSKTGKGSSGLGLGYGTVAVDPDVIPYGTKLYITSTDGKFVYGYAVATDTGIAVQKGQILVDLFYETYACLLYTSRSWCPSPGLCWRSSNHRKREVHRCRA